MRRWLLPVALAALVLPSVAEAIGACLEVLGGGPGGDWTRPAVDLAEAAFAVGVALLILSLADRRPSWLPIWLLDRRVLDQDRRTPDRP